LTTTRGERGGGETRLDRVVGAGVERTIVEKKGKRNLRQLISVRGRNAQVGRGEER